MFSRTISRQINMKKITQRNIVNVYRYIKHILTDFQHLKNILDPMGLGLKRP